MKGTARFRQEGADPERVYQLGKEITDQVCAKAALPQLKHDARYYLVSHTGKYLQDRKGKLGIHDPETPDDHHRFWIYLCDGHVDTAKVIEESEVFSSGTLGEAVASLTSVPQESIGLALDLLDGK